jgi:hypothetical protein
MVTPSNFTQFNESHLAIQLLPPYSVDDKYLQFNWTLTQFNPAFMEIQLLFESPLHVSSGKRS